MTNKFLHIVQEVKSTVEHIHLEQPIAAQLGHRNPLATSSPCKLTSKTNTATNVPADRQQTQAVLANNGDEKDSGAVVVKRTADAHSRTGELTDAWASAPESGMLLLLEGFERLAHLLTGSGCVSLSFSLRSVKTGLPRSRWFVHSDVQFVWFMD